MIIRHFRCQATAVRPGTAGRGGGAAPSPAPESEAPTPAGPGLTPVLDRLRGQQVTLYAGGRSFTGRLLTSRPVTLAGPAGEATVVRPPAVESVEF